MAGVGFSIRKLRADDTYSGALQVYASAALISSGPWLISILALLVVGIFAASLAPDPADVERFQTAITWLFGLSLLLTTPLQLVFTRYVSDLIYADHPEKVLPSLWGALAFTSTVAAVVAAVGLLFFDDCSLLTRALLLFNFVVLCDTWMAIVMLSGIREHRQVLRAFLMGYATIVVACMALAPQGENGLLFGFLLGQGVLLFWSCHVAAIAEPSVEHAQWGFLRPTQIYPDLLLIGLCYAFGTWADKLIFWLHPQTSHAVIGLFRASEVYDLPIFLAYLASAPGMAAFLLEVETRYAERHQAFFNDIETGSNLLQIEANQERVIRAARTSLGAIFKAQGITFVLCAIWGSSWLNALGISNLHLPLFLVDVAAVSMQVLVLAIMSIYFYLDRRQTALRITSLLFASNFTFSLLSIELGPNYFGYGFALAALLTMVVSFVWLRRDLEHLVRDTFMLQGVAS